MPQLFPDRNQTSRCIKIIHIPSERPGCHIQIIMDGKQGLGHLVRSPHDE
jgi:hypothetical protein